MQAVTDFRCEATAGWGGTARFRGVALDFDNAASPGGLDVRVLRTATERLAIAGLRRHAAFETENDLRLGLEPFEQTRDEIGHVVAIYRGDRVVASARAVPTGYGLTAAERLLGRVAFDASVLRRGSWEIGRMVMEQEERNRGLLQDCLALCLEEFIQHEHVRHVHATTSTPAMARLWRRLGMRTLGTGEGVSGRRYALVHAGIESLMAALHVPHYVDERPELPVPAARRGEPTGMPN